MAIKRLLQHFVYQKSRNGNANLYMIDYYALLVDMEHLDAVDRTPVRGLSAALGVEGGLIQLHLKAVLALEAINDHRRKFRHAGVGVEQLVRFHGFYALLTNRSDGAEAPNPFSRGEGGPPERSEE